MTQPGKGRTSQSRSAVNDRDKDGVGTGVDKGGGEGDGSVSVDRRQKTPSGVKGTSDDRVDLFPTDLVPGDPTEVGSKTQGRCTP